MKLTKRDKLLIIVLVFILLAVVFYMYVYTPLRNDINDLETKNASLKKKKSDIISKSSALKQIDKKILNAKIEAIPYENIACGTDSSVLYADLIENLFIYNNGTEVKKLYYTTSADKELYDFDFNGSTISTKKITKVNEKGKKETYSLNMFPASASFTANRNAEEGLEDIWLFLQRTTDTFRYIHISSYKINVPSQTSGDSENSRYSITMSLEIYVADGNWHDYELGTCPCTLEDGITICGAYNEFDANACHECGGRIDTCPNPNCGKLIPLDTTLCPYCGAIVKTCPNCNELMLDESDYCGKCNQKVD